MIEVSEAVTVRFLPPHSWFQSASANGCQSPRSTDPRQPSWLTNEFRVWLAERQADDTADAGFGEAVQAHLLQHQRPPPGRW